MAKRTKEIHDWLVGVRLSKPDKFL